MKLSGKHFVSKRVIAYEVASFLFIIVIIWLDELLDLPHMLLGAEPTPINWREASGESVVICILGAAIIYMTPQLFLKMKYLEGILSVCASCKKIRDDKGAWIQIEAYIRDRSEAEFSHGLCPECAKRLDSGFYADKKK